MDTRLAKVMHHHVRYFISYDNRSTEADLVGFQNKRGVNIRLLRLARRGFGAVLELCQNKTSTASGQWGL